MAADLSFDGGKRVLDAAIGGTREYGVKGHHAVAWDSTLRSHVQRIQLFLYIDAGIAIGEKPVTADSA